METGSSAMLRSERTTRAKAAYDNLSKPGSLHLDLCRGLVVVVGGMHYELGSSRQRRKNFRQIAKSVNWKLKIYMADM
jgi:hypothetical protein